MKSFLLGVLVTIVVLATCMFAYLRLGLPEVRADLPPPRWESYLMYISVHASVRRRAPELPNPIKPTDENLIAGGKFYLDACAGCHGTPGKPFGGKGPVLYPPIPELPVVGTEYSEAQIFWIARHGLRRSGMFANGVWASDEKLWTAAAYVKHLKSLPPAVQAAVAKLAEAQH
jgi:mono/diheme cytochrome c family protein